MERNRLVWFEFVDLLDMHSQTTCSVQPTRAHVALEMLGFLVLHEHYIAPKISFLNEKLNVQKHTLLIFEFSLAIPAPGADNL